VYVYGIKTLFLRERRKVFLGSPPLAPPTTLLLAALLPSFLFFYFQTVYRRLRLF
jgi:hypothetical protein